MAIGDSAELDGQVRVSCCDDGDDERNEWMEVTGCPSAHTPIQTEFQVPVKFSKEHANCRRRKRRGGSESVVEKVGWRIRWRLRGLVGLEAES